MSTKGLLRRTHVRGNFNRLTGPTTGGIYGLGPACKRTSIRRFEVSRPTTLVAGIAFLCPIPYPTADIRPESIPSGYCEKKTSPQFPPRWVTQCAWTNTPKISGHIERAVFRADTRYQGEGAYMDSTWLARESRSKRFEVRLRAYIRPRS